MLEKAKKTIRRFNMLAKGDRVVVAVSGGVDSTVLLHILMNLRGKYHLDLIVAHLNHSMRGEASRRDARFVEALAKRLGLPFEGRTVDLPSILKAEKTSPQVAARRVRYTFFEETLKRHGANRIATGHTMDDQVETVLMRFLKGTGLRGLRGIPPVRGIYIRPLLEVTRTEVERYATEQGISYTVDSSNEDTRYIRNRIRRELIPLIEEVYNPGIKDDLARFAFLMARDEEYIEGEVDKVYSKNILRQDEDGITFNLKDIQKLPEALVARVFIKGVEEVSGSPLYSYHIGDILDLISRGGASGSIDLPYGLTLYKEYDLITLTREVHIATPSFEKGLNVPGDTTIKEIGKTFKTTVLCNQTPGDLMIPPNSELQPLIKSGANSTVAYFDYNKLNTPLIVRNFIAGDRFRPLGMEGTKKVKELFIERKMPRSHRSKIPIILSGDDIIWVVGLREADWAKVRKDTKKVLRIEVI